MPENDFLPFSIGAGANVLSQAQYAALAAVTQGFGPGLAASAQFNKVWRQSSFVAAAIAAFIANNANVNVLDDGNINEFITNFGIALNVYLQSVSTVRTRLLASPQYYVNALTGNDSNPGSSSAPFATLQRAANYIFDNLDLNGQTVTINCTGAFAPAAGTSAINISGFPVGGSSPNQIVFNFATGSSISTTGSAPCISTAFGASLLIEGSVTLNSAGSGIQASALLGGQGGGITVGAGVTFGTVGYAHMFGNVGVNGNYTISGNAQYHLAAINNSSFIAYTQAFPVSVTVLGTPAFTAFATSTNGGEIAAFSTNVSFTGPAMGQRYLANYGGAIFTAGGGPNFFPGSVAGVADGATFGLYA